MERLKWFEITLDHERRLHNQSKSVVAVLQQQLAEAQGWVARMTTYLRMERDRGDTYKRLFHDRQGIEEQLQVEMRRRESYQQRYEDLSRATAVKREG